MSQNVWSSINPDVTSGAMLASLLTALKSAICSGFSGTARPANLQTGGMWVDTTNAATPTYYYSLKMYTGSTDVEIFRVNVNANYGGGAAASSEFSITRVSADTNAAILNMIKQRILDNGQVADGDVVAEIQIIGATDTGSAPVVGKLIWTSNDDQEVDSFGGFLSFHSTPDASNTLTEHIRFLNGLVEFKVPHKLNSLRLVGQDIATTATITQLDATKVLVEFTGSTATDLKGINSAQDTQEINLHNRSSATVTLKHQSLDASSADRFKLPLGIDFSLIAEASVVLYYCTTDTKWKVKATAHSVLGKNVKILRGVFTDWVCPSGVTQILLTPFKRRQTMMNSHNTAIDVCGNPYIWGANAAGGVGDGTVTTRTSPTTALVGIRFSKFADGNITLTSAAQECSIGIDATGIAYGWGVNAQGQLGLGDVTPRSSPVAVLGGLKWAHVWAEGNAMYGTTLDGRGSYAWGNPAAGTFGPVNTKNSSPVAILGGFVFEQFDTTSGANGANAACGLGTDGVAYFWGGHSSSSSYIAGGGGNGAASSLISSPVAVIGGLTFKKIGIGLSTVAGVGSGVYALGLSSSGDLYAWGANHQGMLAQSNNTHKSSPVAVLSGTKIYDFAMSGYGGTTVITNPLAFAIAEDGTLYSWGLNTNGQLGDGTVTSRSSPVAVLGGLKFREVIATLGTGSAGSGAALGITLEGDMYAWGNNTFGELGVGDVTPRSSPVAVLGGIKWSHFPQKGSRYAVNGIMAVASDGTLYAWGQAVEGTTSSPVAVVGGKTLFDSRSAQEVIAIPVTAGDTYRIYMPNGRQAKFGGTAIGNNIERVSIEYDTRGNA